MFKSKSLYHLIVYSILFIIVLISFFSFILIDNAHEEFQAKVTSIKEEYLENKKATLKNEITTIINFIEYYENKFDGKEDLKTIQKNILDAIESLKADNNLNDYVFIYDVDGNLIHYPVDQTKEGKNLYNIQDREGKPVIQELINVSKNNWTLLSPLTVLSDELCVPLTINGVNVVLLLYSLSDKKVKDVSFCKYFNSNKLNVTGNKLGFDVM